VDSVSVKVAVVVVIVVVCFVADNVVALVN